MYWSCRWVFCHSEIIGGFRIKMHAYNGKPFIYELYNILFAPDLCYQLFSRIVLMNLDSTWPFYKRFCTVLFSDNEQNMVTLPHILQKKHTFLVKTKENSIPQKNPKKKVSLELLHQTLGHRLTRSLLGGCIGFFGNTLNSG